jgi:cation diffusion facilitator family transporter
LSSTNENIAIKTTYLSLLSSIVLAIIKWLAGFFGNSYALIADAIESTSDVFASLLILFGLKYASKPADDNHPYGHGRIEPLLTFMVVGFLITSALVIAYHSIKNIQTPHALPERWTLYILAIIIIFKEISFQVISKRSKITNSSALKADAWHHRSDAITSIAAFVGISIAVYLGKGYESADDWAALFASIFILYNSYLIFRPALAEIMDEHLYDDLVALIRKEAQNVVGVVDTEKCFVRKVGMKFYIDLHIAVDGSITVTRGHDIAHSLKDQLLLKIPELKNVLIHVEPN